MTSLIESAHAPDFPAEIAVVISNVAGAPGLAKATAAGIPALTIESKSFGEDREAFERTMQDALIAQRIDLICLAGFMRLLTPWFVQQWTGRMLNIHPALLPSYRGLHTHERALADGVRIHGATVHFVVPDMDCGPIIIQGAVAVRDDDTADTLGARVLSVEHRIYPAALRAVARGEITAEGNRTFGGIQTSDATLITPAFDS